MNKIKDEIRELLLEKNKLIDSEENKRRLKMKKTIKTKKHSINECNCSYGTICGTDDPLRNEPLRLLVNRLRDVFRWNCTQHPRRSTVIRRP